MNDKDKKRVEKIGLRIATLRKKKGLTQRGLADKCNVDHRKINRLEKHEVNLTVTTLIELAEGLDMHPKDLLNIDFDE